MKQFMWARGHSKDLTVNLVKEITIYKGWAEEVHFVFFSFY